VKKFVWSELPFRCVYSTRLPSVLHYAHIAEFRIASLKQIESHHPISKLVLQRHCENEVLII